MVCPPPGKRKRAWAPKRRTGCRSCKIRRLRCDETRPICDRCVKSGFLCEWDVPADASTDNCPNSATSTVTTSKTLTWVSGDHHTSTSTSTSTSTLQPTFHPKSLASALQTIYTTSPSSPYSSPPDYIYHHYFLRHIAPLLSTTLAWRTMWSTTIPQIAWTSAAIRNGIVALAACYEGMRSGQDREVVVRGKLVGSLKAFREEAGHVKGEGGETMGVGSREDEALIMCRVMASLCQAKEDWEGARMHMGYGARILREMALSPSCSCSRFSEACNSCGKGGGGRKKVSQIVRLVAPTYMNALSEPEQESLLGRSVTDEQRRIWHAIIGFRAKFKAYYVQWIEALWPQVNRSLKAHLLTTWSTINHTINSALFPDLVFFREEDPVVPIQEVTRQLEWRRQLHPLEELAEMADTVLREIDDHMHRPPAAFPQAATQPLEDQLRICVENYMVQASIFEPRMSAGTYWSSNPEPECSVELRLRRFTDAEAIPTGYAYEGCPHDEWQSCVAGSGTAKADEMQNFYLEHVCPYRSGLLPNRVDGCPIYTLKKRPGGRLLFRDG